jgi:hypothetical protein
MKYLAVFLVVIFAVIFFWPQSPEKEKLVERTFEVSDFKISDSSWKKYNPLREVRDPALGVILGDLESHIAKEHKYFDTNKITWAHQVSHGINANLRNRIQDKELCNCFYVLRDRYISLREPNISIRDIALEVPEKLRGPSFNMYLVDSMDRWNDKPLYIFDEWVAFTNGAEVGKELNFEGWYFELFQAHNFNVYCLYLAMVVNRDVSNYNDMEMKKFLRWNIERVFMISNPSDRDEIDKDILKKTVSFNSNHFCPHCRIDGSGSNFDLNRSKEYVKMIRNSPEAEKLRQFAKEYFGEDWCKKTYGF